LGEKRNIKEGPKNFERRENKEEWFKKGRKEKKRKSTYAEREKQKESNKGKLVKDQDNQGDTPGHKQLVEGG